MRTTSLVISKALLRVASPSVDEAMSPAIVEAVVRTISTTTAKVVLCNTSSSIAKLEVHAAAVCPLLPVCGSFHYSMNKFMMCLHYHYSIVATTSCSIDIVILLCKT